jgi:signal transduction histidine kinase
VNARSWARAAAWAATCTVAATLLLADRSSGFSFTPALGDAMVAAAFGAAALAESAAPARQRALVAAVGIAWALGGTAPLVALHRGAFAHALLAFPDGRLVGARRRGTVLAAYAVALATTSLAPAAAVLAATALVALPRRGGRSGLPWLYPWLSATSVAAWLAVEAWLAAAGSPLQATPATVIYEALLVAAAAGFPLAARAQSRALPADIAGVVVALDPAGGLSGFANALARLVEDPTLQVLEWDDDTATYIDPAGAPAGVSADEGALLVDRDGQPLAAVLHRPGALSSPGMAPAVESAVRLAVQHARLRREEQRQVAELMASRHRLQVSADTQRVRIEARLRQRVAAPAATLAEMLRRDSAPSGEPEVLVQSAEAELTAVAMEITALARGLRPPVLDGGLDAAVAELARRSALSVDVANDLRGALPSEVETAAYFVCAETLANTAKHSGVTAAHVQVEVGVGVLRVRVRDDGVGGADLSEGTGLLGLADRVAALGGRLVVKSPPGGPTTVTATLPLSADPQPGM